MRKQSLFHISKRDALPLGKALLIRGGILLLAIEAATAKLESGELHVFDCSTFTVKGENLTSYMADVDTDEAFTPDTEVIKDGYFAESEFRSAPYFNVQIDGINLLGVE